MASVIRRIRRTRVKLEHGYDTGAWWRHGSQHPKAIRNRARIAKMHPLVVGELEGTTPASPVMAAAE